MRSLVLVVAISSVAALAHPLDELDVTKPLEAKLLKGLALDELRFLRNSVYARHGRAFESPSLTTFFSSRDWYTVDGKYSDALLTPVERANIELIARTEKALGGAWSETKYLEWIASTLSELIPDGSVGITATPDGKWEVLHTCGLPSVRASVSTVDGRVVIAEDYVEGGEPLFMISVLLRDGPKKWIALQPDSPKEPVRISREGAHTLVDDQRYGSPAGLRKRETISAAGCRKTGH